MLTVDVLAAAYPEVENTATASAPGSPPVSSIDTAPVLPLVAWSITKELADYSNHQAEYLITVTNTGQNTSVSPMTVTDNLPSGLEFVSAEGTGWTCPPAGALVECVHDAGIAPGESRELTVAAKVTAAPGTVIENVASVSGGGGSTAGFPVPPVEPEPEPPVDGGEKPPVDGGEEPVPPVDDEDPAPPPGAGQTPAADSGPALVEATTNGKLADTGSSGTLLLWAGLLILLAGAGVLWLERRRRGTPA